MDVLENHKKLIFKIAASYCSNAEDRRDLTQEIILQLWNSFPKYDPTFAFSTWIYRIALNVSISFVRKEKSRKKVSVPVSDSVLELAESPAESDSQDENIRKLYGFIRELNELDKALMILYLEGNKQEEIAGILGISKSNVATKIGRIKTRLKSKFSNQKII